MKLYRITYDSGERSRSLWTGTQADAKAQVKKLRSELERWNVDDYEEVNILTDKASLLDWLNINCAVN